MQQLRFLPGKPLPLGASVQNGGVNFSVFTRNGAGVFLEFFENPKDASPFESYRFDPRLNRTGDIWHVFVEGLGPEALYLYRVDGPFRPSEGLRFNVNKYLLDPYAKAMTAESIFLGQEIHRKRTASLDPDLAFSTTDTAEHFPKCIVVDDDAFDWQGDRPLNYPLRLSVLYEAHVKGLSVHRSSGAEHPGTYRGIIEMIPYLKRLGITSLELLPIHEFDEHENDRLNPRTGERLHNYWGYSTVGFFAPKATYAADQNGSGPVREFKEMVRELHKAKIEVILDIVFNHTAEGNERGPTISFRGFDNSIYYMLEDNKRFYRNYSGCGNTFNCNHPVVRTLLLDSLRYWVTEMHVDGFRFDLGSILGRDQRGRMMENPPMLERIAEDPVLRHTKIIAEAWDAGGAYQVGWFPGGRWAEWNDRFRDDVRAFWRGDSGQVKHFATRITGSSDLYLRDGRKPFHSINFITSHDGFTLNDLVSYNGKHNDENGESNRDGGDHNISYNYGFEGPAVNPKIEAIRNRQIKNMLCSMMLSLGTPMLLMGDEIRRTQQGNNNAYCQDSEISWMNYAFADKHADVQRFTREIIAFRRRHPAFLRPEFFTGSETAAHVMPDIVWFGPDGRSPDWSALDHFIAYQLIGSRATILTDCDDNDFYIMYNASQRDITATIAPPLEGKKWFRVIDTSYDSPLDILETGMEEMLQNQQKYVILSRSAVVLISRNV
ncbi:MAG TPA: glycogen debranching protein GlgX [Treponemataceae bacterium]|nr:glycogen debranching protein GlgX [Treponemataceae bacterium]